MSGELSGLRSREMRLLGKGEGIDQHQIAVLEIAGTTRGQSGALDLAGGGNQGIRELDRPAEHASAGTNEQRDAGRRVRVRRRVGAESTARAELAEPRTQSRLFECLLLERCRDGLFPLHTRHSGIDRTSGHGRAIPHEMQ